LHADEDGRLHSSAKSGKPPELKRERPAGRRAAKRQNSLIYRPLCEPLEGPCRWSLPRPAVEVPLGFVCVLDRSPRRPGQAARLTAAGADRGLACARRGPSPRPLFTRIKSDSLLPSRRLKPAKTQRPVLACVLGRLPKGPRIVQSLTKWSEK